MKKYEIIVSDLTKEKLRSCLAYLKFQLDSEQAAKSVYQDYVLTRKKLESLAGSIRLDDDPDLAALGYHRMHFEKHNYFLLYRVEGDKALIDYLFHDLEDYRNKIN